MANLPPQSDMKSLPYAFAMDIPQNIEKSILPNHMMRLYWKYEIKTVYINIFLKN